MDRLFMKLTKEDILQLQKNMVITKIIAWEECSRKYSVEILDKVHDHVWNKIRRKLSDILINSKI